MNDHQATTIENQTQAVIRLLLGDRQIEPTLLFVAGGELGPFERISLGCWATDTQVDVVYIGFRVDEIGTPVLADISILLPRDQICSGWRECALTMIPGKNRAALVTPRYEGYFTILPGEIIRQRKRPEWVKRGVYHATARFADLVVQDIGAPRHPNVLMGWAA